MTPYDQGEQVDYFYQLCPFNNRYLFATPKDTLLPPQLSARRYSPLYLELRTRGGVTPKSIDGDWADGGRAQARWTTELATKKWRETGARGDIKH